ncbi:helix-turn-helix domain-containing protein [Antrihabitans sp. NCIMB 15449]|uniref:Helix-turn-helix domain-containing protein n=1 Tax=Antrihabitans spumae TaxID=3373370 RepID=A0ABW7JGU8_9NOCA
MVDSLSPDDTSRDRRPGRPRDTAIDDAALAAARTLLAEVGWDRTTMVAIAERADVGKPALYRRWPSKTHLIFEAVFGWVPDHVPVAEAQSADDWVERSFDYTLDMFGRPDVRAALPGLLATLRDNPDLQSNLWRQFGSPAVDMLSDTLDNDGATTDSALDAQATMLLIIGSSMLVRLLLRGDAADAVAARLPGILRAR